MFSELILVHRSANSLPLIPHSQAASLPERFLGRHAFYFKTCLRQILIIDAENLSAVETVSEDAILRGSEAYRFVLQVVCGLHSPLIGETEVSGQFKLAVGAFAVPADPWGQQLKRFFANLFEDAKRIRQTHLVDLGSQSYGSVLRREFKRLAKVRTIHVLGAGHLVQEILPWIAKDGIEIHVHCRDTEKARTTLGKRTVIAIHSLKETVSFGPNDAFVVAAPVSAAWLNDWMAHYVPAGDAAQADRSPQIVADLRADSVEDPMRLSASCRVLNLSQVFAHISETQSHLETCKAAALKAIDEAVDVRNRFVEYRPFGWEDVCA